MDSSLKIYITCKFSDFAVRSLLSASGSYINLLELQERSTKHRLCSKNLPVLFVIEEISHNSLYQVKLLLNCIHQRFSSLFIFHIVS